LIAGYFTEDQEDQKEDRAIDALFSASPRRGAQRLR
jgi:hypothetical protein